MKVDFGQVSKRNFDKKLFFVNFSYQKKFLLSKKNFSYQKKKNSLIKKKNFSYQKKKNFSYQKKISLIKKKKISLIKKKKISLIKKKFLLSKKISLENCNFFRILFNINLCLSGNNLHLLKIVDS